MEAPGIRTKICTITIMFAINSSFSFHFCFLDFELGFSNKFFFIENHKWKILFDWLNFEGTGIPFTNLKKNIKW